MTLLLLAALLLLTVALLPAVLLLRRQPAAARGRQEAALALHRAQLREVERDAWIATGERDAARLEVERRLLAAGASPDAAPAAGGRFTLAAALVAIPVVAIVLYLAGGHPGVPADPLGPRLAAEARADAQADMLIARLRAGLATLDPKSTEARTGEILLGNVQARLGRWGEAAQAWRAAVAAGFDPLLADQAAEADILAHTGRISDDDAALIRQAVAAAPADAPWRLQAEARLAEHEHQAQGK